MAGNTPCAIGAAAEMRFASAAAEHGFGVLLPWGHAHPYDLVTDADGVLMRVQVKQASYEHQRDRWNLDTRVTRRYVRAGTEVRTPNEGGYDVLAGWADMSLYLFPVALTQGRSGITLRPPGCRRRSSGPVAIFDPEMYRDAWSVLKGRE